MTSFIDSVPLHFFDHEERIWYRYISQSAPVDLKKGDGGAYLTFVTKAWENSATNNSKSYGLPDEYMEMFDTGHRHLATDADSYRGQGSLTEEQKQNFYQRGYLVVTIPSSLTTRLPVKKCIDNYTQFYRMLSGDTNFSIHPEGTTTQEGTLRGKRYSKQDPLNPFVRRPKTRSRTADLLSSGTGTGPGSTYLLEPFYLAFQYSSFVHNLLASFYRPGMIEPLLVVQEAFQIIQSPTSWTPFKINNIPFQLIPRDHHHYRHTNRLPSF